MAMPDSRSNKTSILYTALACSLALNAVLLLSDSSSDETQNASSIETSEVVAAVDGADAQPTPRTAGNDLGTTGSAEVLETTPTKPPAPAVPDAAWKVVHANVVHSLARTLQRAAGDDGDALTSVFSRLFVWDVNLTRDLQAGDAISAVWRKRTDGLPVVAAATLQSSKLGRTLTSYRWQAPGDPFASNWHLDGTEVPLRLKDGPITDYEQITSLLKDRPTHKGMDFKTPVGTEVTSPRAGMVTRSNWNWKANGNCIEVRYDDGVLAKFLHLNENRVKPGERVRVGQVIALTGNTGHSTAPHLHYQLDRGTKTLDPLEYHGTIRRSLGDEQVAALRLAVADFETMLGDGDTTAQSTAGMQHATNSRNN